MLAVIGKESWWDVNTENIEKFPCTDLRTIDRLWVKYSNGRFGFSVQKQIWQSVGGQLGVYDHDIDCAFGDTVGWRVNNRWLSNRDDLTFSLKSPHAPPGHLPVGGLGVVGFCVDFCYLFSRVETCKM